MGENFMGEKNPIYGGDFYGGKRSDLWGRKNRMRFEMLCIAV
jgi:hypothetical protein